MYLLNTATEIQWVLPPTASPPGINDLDVVTIEPDGTILYYNSSIALNDYVAPTATTQGSAKFTFTPDVEGLWKILLVVGTSSNYSVIGKADAFVFDNTLEINPQNTQANRLANTLEIDWDTLPVSNGAYKLVFKGNNISLSEIGDVVTITVNDFPTVTYKTTNDLIAGLNGVISTSELNSSLNTRINLIDGTGPGNIPGQISNVQSQIDSIQSTINDSSTGLSATATALDVVELWTANRDGELLAAGKTFSSLIAEVGSNSTSIATQSVINSDLSAQYTVKIDTGNRITGFGLASSSPTDPPFSQFQINADAFAITAPANTSPDAAGEENYPFFHLTTSSTVNGKTYPPGTYLKKAMIGDATIENAMIGNTIQSDDGGVSWSINKNGGISARNITLMATDGTVLLQNDSTGKVFQKYSDLLPDTPTTAGLYADSNYLGYHNGTSWKSYLGADGKFFLDGNGTNSLQWDGTLLTIKGSIVSSSFTTSLTNTKRIEINTNNSNEIYFYGDVSGSISKLASIGINSVGSDSIVGHFGNDDPNLGSYLIGVYGTSYNSVGVYGNSFSSSGIYGRSINSLGVTGRSDNNYGVYATSTNAPGLYAYSYSLEGFICGSKYEVAAEFRTEVTSKGSIRLVPYPGFTTGAPTWVAQVGTMVTRSDGATYVNQDGSTTWRYLG